MPDGTGVCKFGAPIRRIVGIGEHLGPGGRGEGWWGKVCFGVDGGLSGRQPRGGSPKASDGCKRDGALNALSSSPPVAQSERQKTLNAIRAEEEERIAVAMARKQQEKDRSEREVQRLREQSDELRRWVAQPSWARTGSRGRTHRDCCVYVRHSALLRLT